MNSLPFKTPMRNVIHKTAKMQNLCSCWLGCLCTTWQTLVPPWPTQPGHLLSPAAAGAARPARACTSATRLGSGCRPFLSRLVWGCVAYWMERCHFTALAEARYNSVKKNTGSSDAKWQNSCRCHSFWLSAEYMA